ncbi:MAG: hypothetical protein ACYC91_17495 [Solirubrobacteraceae bacterium]
MPIRSRCPVYRLGAADPAGRPIAEVRATRDEIARRVQKLSSELDDPSTTTNPTTKEHA